MIVRFKIRPERLLRIDFGVAGFRSLPILHGLSHSFGSTSFASFDMFAGVTLTVTCSEPVQSVKILPTSYGIVPKVQGNTIYSAPHSLFGLAPKTNSSVPP
jgi:hypothetical protein